MRVRDRMISISVSAAGCRVTLADGEVLRAEAVVCALPVSVLHELEIDGVTPARLASLRAQRHACAAKIVTVYDRAIWAELGANGLSEGELLLGSTWPQREGVLSGLVCCRQQWRNHYSPAGRVANHDQQIWHYRGHRPGR